MIITKINESTLMFELFSEEIINTDKEDLLYYILNTAIEQENIDTKNNTILIEGVPTGKGMVFLLTIRLKRKRYRIKRKKSYKIYVFNKLDDFLNCVVALYKSKIKAPESSTYTMNTLYYLCFWEEPCVSAKVLAEEFGKAVPKSNSFISYIKEHGNVLTKSNSVNLIGKSFTCKEP